MNACDIFSELGLETGMQLSFKVKGKVCSGIYPMSGHGYVEAISGNSILIKTSKGYRVTIHDYEIMCKDITITVRPKKMAL